MNTLKVYHFNKKPREHFRITLKKKIAGELRFPVYPTNLSTVVEYASYSTFYIYVSRILLNFFCKITSIIFCVYFRVML